jgi:UDP:flavonoid glycosyltransferase YjiC (YdhE family)
MPGLMGQHFPGGAHQPRFRGEPPVYFGFGSIRAPRVLGKAMIHTARALGRRAIVSRGWADLSPLDDEPDCMSIGVVNQQALFQRVAPSYTTAAQAQPPLPPEPERPRS